MLGAVEMILSGGAAGKCGEDESDTSVDAGTPEACATNAKK